VSYTIRYKAWVTRYEGGKMVETFCEVKQVIGYMEDGNYETTDFDYKECSIQPSTKPVWRLK